MVSSSMVKVKSFKGEVNFNVSSFKMVPTFIIYAWSKPISFLIRLFKV